MEAIGSTTDQVAELAEAGQKLDQLSIGEDAAAAPAAVADKEEEDVDKQREERRARAREVDKRSIYVGNVDFQSTLDELDAFFSKAGLINRITILNDRFTGRPKGFAYIEFDAESSIGEALKLDGEEFKGRKLRVAEKRTNLPHRGKFRGRGAFRGRPKRGVDSGNGAGTRSRSGDFTGADDPADSTRPGADGDPATTTDTSTAVGPVTTDPHE